MLHSKVTFDIDANGILNVAAKDRGTGKEQTVTITGSTTLDKGDVDRMVKDAEANAAEDKNSVRAWPEGEDLEGRHLENFAKDKTTQCRFLPVIYVCAVRDILSEISSTNCHGSLVRALQPLSISVWPDIVTLQ